MTSYEHRLRGYPVRTLSKNLPTYHQVDINYCIEFLWCAVKACSRNAEMPGGIQVPPEPVDLSSGDHPHCEQHGPEKAP